MSDAYPGAFAEAAANGPNAHAEATSGLKVAGVPVEQAALDPSLDCEVFRRLRAATRRNAEEHAKEKERRRSAMKRLYAQGIGNRTSQKMSEDPSPRRPVRLEAPVRAPSPCVWLSGSTVCVGQSEEGLGR